MGIVNRESKGPSSKNTRLSWLQHPAMVSYKSTPFSDVSSLREWNFLPQERRHCEGSHILLLPLDMAFPMSKARNIWRLNAEQDQRRTKTAQGIQS